MTKIEFIALNENSSEIVTIKEFVIDTTMFVFNEKDKKTIAYTFDNCDTISIHSNNTNILDIIAITITKNDFSITLFGCDSISYNYNDTINLLCKNNEKF